MDNDAKMIKNLNHAIIDLQVKYRGCSLTERLQLKPALEELLNDFARYQIKLLKEGTITSESDQKEMKEIKAEVDSAADQQQIALAIAKTIAFVAMKI